MRLPAWVLTAMLVSACTGGQGAEAVRTPSPSGKTSCLGAVSLVASTGESVSVGDVPQRLVVHRGTRLDLRTTGSCGGRVTVSPQQPSTLRRVDSRTLGAESMGETKVLVTVPACALLSPPMPECLGGPASVGTVTVAVSG